MKKFLAFALSAVMTFSLAACGRQDAPVPQASQTQPPAAEEPSAGAEQSPSGEIPSGEAAQAQTGQAGLTVTIPSGEYVCSVRAVDGRLYLATDISGEMNPYSAGAVYAVDMDTGTLTELFRRTENDISNFAVCDDGSVWYVTNSYDPDASYCALCHASAGGQELARIPAGQLNPTDTDIGFVDLAPLPGGMLATITSGATLGLHILNPDGSLAVDTPVSDGSLSCLATLADGTLATIFQSRDAMGNITGTVLRTIDPASGAMTDLPLTDEENLIGSYPEILCGDAERILLTNGSANIYDRTSGVLSRGFDWRDMGVIQLALAFFRSDGTLWAADTGDEGLLRVFPVREGGDERQVLTLAGMMIRPQVTRAVAQFNRENPNYRIEMTDYMVSGRMRDESLELFNYEIIAGNVPDILVLDDLPRDTLVKQGLLLDLNPYLDADPDIDRANYFPCALDAGSQDGTLLSLIPRFSLITLAARSGLTDEKGLTTAQFLDMAYASQPLMPAGSDPEERAGLLVELLSGALYDFFDLSTGVCDFENEDFPHLMDAVRDMPTAQIQWSEMGEATYPACRLAATQLSGWFGMEAEAGELLGEDFVYCGYPSADGGVSVLRPDLELAITTASQAPDACWQFMRQFLLEKPAGDSFDDYMLKDVEGFSAKIDVYEAERRAIVDAYALYGEDVLDDAAIRDILDMPLVVSRWDDMADAVTGIIYEESVSFFNGQISTAQTAANIQSRVSLFMSEQS